ncbi:hypothetical protein SAMN04488515_1718 [Cognatiyoonia koreensis]|uniref:Uncharacterized protein n=1 Tax=Cognatiyoonia koreensis TaxID=364200 RepID=A0A1I0Q7L6_9RHOB|nr:hypothetical protein [Cognatiyoonia koreensis]SEW22783.1 hypothetical protein SAMN04488515_1718 [Cognatiyoonia koreensis]
MQQQRPKAHFIFVILSALAAPLGAFIIAFTLLVAIELPHQTGMIDLGPFFAIFGALALLVLTAIMVPIWYAIYRESAARVGGYLGWSAIFTLIFGVNAFVFNGFVQRNLPWDAHAGYFEAVGYTLARPDGSAIFLLLWPLIPALFFAVLWVRSRTFKLLALPS